MRRRQPARCPIPRLWLLSDTRVPDARLLAAAQRLPRGAGLMLRQSSVADARLAQIARRRGLQLAVKPGAAPAAIARQATWLHGGRIAVRRSGWAGARVFSGSAHNLGEMRAAERAGAALLFVSPLFATASHPGGRRLGVARFAALARLARVPVIALGGMTRARARHIVPALAQGWAAIDGLVKSGCGADQKRISVPT